MELVRRCFSIGKRATIYVSPTQETFAFRGCVEVEVLRGVFDILGFQLNRRSGRFPVYSTAVQCAVSVTTIQKEDNEEETCDSLTAALEKLRVKEKLRSKIEHLAKYNAILVFHNYQNKISSCLATSFVRLYKPKEDEEICSDTGETSLPYLTFVKNEQTSTIHIPYEWRKLALHLRESYKETGTPFRIMVCGGKHSGKSTLIRFLSNTFLNEYKSVCHLDCDPGQSEFVPSGCVALTDVDEPLLGPPFLHQKDSIKCYFAGGPDVTQFPNHYVDYIKKLFNYFENSPDHSKKQLLINTMGFVKGLGLNLLFDIITITKPTHIVQLHRGVSKVWNLESLKESYLSTLTGWVHTWKNDLPPYHHVELQSYVTDRQVLTSAPLLRSLGIFAYFSLLQKNPIAIKPLLSHTPYKIAWSNLALFCSSEMVPNHQIMYSMNGSIVALCVTSNFHKLPTVDESLPKFLSDMPDGEWIGYGIVRGIDMEEKTFYIITPVSVERLQTVNVLIKSSIEIMEEMVIQQKTTGHVPYTTKMSQVKRLIGSRVMRKRKYTMKGGRAKYE